MINNNNGKVYIGVDKTNVASGRGRDSVRLESKKLFSHGTFIVLDMDHMPGGACGEWPAFWSYNPTNWPNDGEIDIIEGVNSQTGNTMALHTNSGDQCKLSQTSVNVMQSSSYINFQHCDYNDNSQPANTGCQVGSSNTTTYGAGFNSNGGNQGNGGVYAMYFEEHRIRVWSIPRGNLPFDLVSGIPYVESASRWGKPLAYWYQDTCYPSSWIRNQAIVLNNAFCGDWAGAVWSSDAVCSSRASSCQAYVQNNPTAFANSYWSINSLKVYTTTTIHKKRSEPTPPPVASPQLGEIAAADGSNSHDTQWGPPLPAPNEHLPSKRDLTEDSALAEEEHGESDFVARDARNGYSPYVGTGGRVQYNNNANNANANKPKVTVTVTTTVYSGRSTSTRNAGAAAPPKTTRKANANAVGNEFFNRVKVVRATATITKSLAAVPGRMKRTVEEEEEELADLERRLYMLDDGEDGEGVEEGGNSTEESLDGDHDGDVGDNEDGDEDEESGLGQMEDLEGEFHMQGVDLRELLREMKREREVEKREGLVGVSGGVKEFLGRVVRRGEEREKRSAWW